MKRTNNLLVFALILLLVSCQAQQTGKINRKEVVTRHNVVNESMDTLASLTVGNGTFAYTVDATGMQSFPEYYKNGVSLGTQSEWGWNSFPNTDQYRFEETLKSYDFNNEGRDAKYSIQHKEAGRSKEATEYYRVNPHRIQLGNVGLQFYLEDGSKASAADITAIKQTLDLWSGTIYSRFTVGGETVEVWTASAQQDDRIGVKVSSALIEQGRMEAFVRYPYPTGKFLDEAAYYGEEDKHQTTFVSRSDKAAVIAHTLPGTRYFTQLQYTNGQIEEREGHYFVYKPNVDLTTFEFSFAFSPENDFSDSLHSYAAVEQECADAWKAFWLSGAAVDFAGSTDPRAAELERRVVLSQYLTKVQCGGSNPPQETGLTFNSWYGKPHTEMHWWHGVHYALWGRSEIMENTLEYYFKTFEKAKALAVRQGYKGVRWIKMSDNDGNESPSSVAAFLIWQQPHVIYMAELAYRNSKDKGILEKYKKLVFATAEFMADYAYYDKEKDRYNLGLGVIPAQEVFRAAETRNPTYEVAYWDWALRMAQTWKERLGEERDPHWDQVIDKLAPLPVQDGVYLATETATDSYTFPKWMTDHPAVLGALGMVPESAKLDKAIMKNTLDTVWKKWSWGDTWGWDFPMTAMNAARLNLPERALDALFMDIQTNTYLKNGHNYQDGRLRIYLPGNGGVLTAVAMMLEGWDTSTGDCPGFPKDGSWKIKKEGFKKMP
ncbi:hypothetical protein BC792_10174 [Sphingobacterium allocomposti]|uniref:Glycosyl hydrolase family 65 n=1 Tax=Sphingobacterium allocomposti TaxID=415956 RepID=A0A5S5DR59_9SPHI|nr:hypothetical protein [Sphingobacterium composti Yoo et al. 2007 non Ten et al. 2007]TYP98420.1 hypothetical protein BC792_10174 [Sphingobacterium composti Yoo et al. 2007 non Ten et al. 2007]